MAINAPLMNSVSRLEAYLLRATISESFGRLKDAARDRRMNRAHSLAAIEEAILLNLPYNVSPSD